MSNYKLSTIIVFYNKSANHIFTIEVYEIILCAELVLKITLIFEQ